MEDWIKGLISTATKPIRQIAEAARQRISAVYSAFKDTLARIRRGFGRWVESAKAWARAQVDQAVAVLLRLRWLVFTELPRRLASLANSIQAWTRARVEELGRLIRAELIRLRDWLVDQVRGALRALAQVRDLLLARIAELKADFLRIRDRVVGLLFDPSRLVTWILAPLMEAIGRYLEANIERWTEYLWSRRRGIEERVLIMAERILTRLIG